MASLAQISPIIEVDENDSEEEDGETEEDLETQEQGHLGNIPITTPRDEILGNQGEEQLDHDQLQEEEKEDVGASEVDNDGVGDEEEIGANTPESRGNTNNNWHTPLDQTPGQRGGGITPGQGGQRGEVTPGLMETPSLQDKMLWDYEGLHENPHDNNFHGHPRGHIIN